MTFGRFHPILIFSGTLEWYKSQERVNSDGEQQMNTLNGALLQGRSSMAFAVMPLGAEFIAWAEKDKHPCSLYKISNLQAINLTDHVRVTIAPDAICNITGKIVPVHDEMTDLEKVALALLDRYKASHPALAKWIGALIRDPDERRTLDEFVQTSAVDDTDGGSEPMAAWLARSGYAGSGDGRSSYSAAIASETSDPATPVGVRALVDQQLLLLAQAVWVHRNAGRPDGELSTSVKSADGNLYTTVTISLMRNVLDFHDQIVRLVTQ
jgi:hypothetical protein